MTGSLRDSIAEAALKAATTHGGKITLINVGMPLYDLDAVADAAILALREWLEERGLAIVPKEATEEVLWIGIKVRHEGASVGEIYATMIAAAPDALKGEG